MLTADRLTIVFHDDTTRTLPPGTRYELSRAGLHYVTPDGAEGALDGWDVLRVDTWTAAPRTDNTYQETT